MEEAVGNKTAGSMVSTRTNTRTSVTSVSGTKTKTKKAIQQSTRKNSAKKKTAKRKTGVVRKVAHKEKVQSKKVTDLKGVRHLTVSSLTPSKERLQLALLTPFRFPIEYDKVAAQTARYAGIFFVFVGTLLSLMQVHTFNQNIYALINPSEQQALTGSSNGTEVTCLEGTTCNTTATENTETTAANTTSGGNNTTMYVPDPKPDVAIHVRQQDEKVERVTGAAEVRVYVDRAREVLVYTNHVATQKKTRVTATLLSQNEWKAVWDTTALEEGTYELYALVKNDYGSYEDGFHKIIVEHGDETVSEDTAQDATDGSEEQDAAGMTDTSVEEKSEEAPVTSVVAELTEEKELAEEAPKTTEEVLRPNIALEIKGPSPLSGIVEINVIVPDATFVELYAIPKLGLTERFLGLGKKVDSNRSVYRYDTHNTPNGEYFVFAQVRNAFGLYKSDQQLIAVFNKTSVTNNASTTSAPVRNVDANTTNAIVAATYKSSDVVADDGTLLLYKNEPATTSIEKNETEDEVVAEVKRLYGAEAVTLEDAFTRLMSAYRTDDKTAIEAAKVHIHDVRETLQTTDIGLDNEEKRKLFATQIEEDLSRIEKNIETSEKIIRERVGIEITKDTDGDGITDYDEIHLYNTDPRSADSDGDNFTDGVEILGGYNPRDDTPEALLAYESPKELGIVREDLLEVSKIETVATEHTETAEQNNPKAVISGRGLPNSFVTLYIFSSPIVVTVKTNADGSWIYRFDKELESGEHAVYVGITDNTGKIVAKSKPLTFVKTAEAFTVTEPGAVDDAGSLATEEELISVAPTLLGGNMMLIAASLGIVFIGLILIILGLHTESRRLMVVTQ